MKTKRTKVEEEGGSTTSIQVFLNKHLICSITQQLVVDPVTAADGFTYERSAIETWFKTSSKSPLTGLELPTRQLIPNNSIKQMADEFRESNFKTITDEKGTYRGEVNDAGKKHGKGVMKYNTGGGQDIYEGPWENDRRVGPNAIFKFKDGSVYKGTMVNDELGFGELRFNNHVYTGSYEHFRMHGYGQIKYAHGTIFNGYVNQNVLQHGIFTKLNPTANSYKTVHARLIGNKIWKGIIVNMDTSTYTGSMQIVHGIIELTGTGVYMVENGDMFEGTLVIGKKKKGKLSHNDGTIEEGNWKNGNLDGKGYTFFPKYGTHTGYYVGGKMQGIGKFQWLNGQVYEGMYANGVRYGHGKLIYVNGDIYEGMWENDKRHGKGIYTHITGQVIEGNFIDDILQ